MRILPILSLLPNVSMSQRDVQATSWEVTGSVAFSLSVQRNLTWKTYESELVWAVDVLAGEVVSLMNSDWMSNEASATSSWKNGRSKLVNATLPSRVLQSPNPCNITVEQRHRCQVVFASVNLDIDVNADPIQAEASFESIFDAAVGVGRLQTILLTYFPQSQIQVLVPTDVPTEAPTPSIVAGNYFGEEHPTDTLEPPKATSASSEGLSTGGVVGILITLVVILLSVFGIVIALKRRQPSLDDSKQDLVIETQETDLIESFSQAGLEWGSPEIKVEKQDPGYPKERDGSFSVQGLPDPDSYPRETPQSPTSTSSKSPASSPSSKGSRVVDFAGESHDSSEPQELIIHVDGLEAAIMTQDWDTLADAAATIKAANHSSNGSFSRDWSHRDKSWYSALDAGNAAQLDRLVEQGDWAAVYELAISLGAQPSV